MATKQPHQTRHKILEAAFWEIYRNGFHRASIDNMLEGTGLTKGALYHHFPNKRQLGYAVVDEVIGAWIHERWLAPLAAHENPVDGLQATFRLALAEMPEEIVCGGCPLNNLVQEMAALDEGFRIRLERILKTWEKGIADRLNQGQIEGTVGTDLDAEATAAYLVASVEGMAGLAKATKGHDGFDEAAKVYLGVLETLRPTRTVELGVKAPE